MAAQVAKGAISPVELVQNALDRASDVQPHLNCFTELHAEAALADAAAAADMVTRGEPLGRLHGVPIAIKDTTPQAGRRTTLGSYSHEHWIPDDNAHVVQALRRAGAVRIATTTAPEFAYNLLTDSPLWGPTRNPWNLERSPGGSSGGSAAAVAAGVVPLAEGTDMGGSVRIPAAWSGIVGLKPGLGRIPMTGLPGLWDTISHHGPLARSVDDARMFLASVQRPSNADPFSPAVPLDLSGTTPSSVQGRRFALSIGLGCWAVHPEIERAVRQAAAALEAAGAVVEEVDPGFQAEHEKAWGMMWAVFMASYYGHLVHDHGHRMDREVLHLIEVGNSMSAVAYKRLEMVRTDVWNRLAGVLDNHDALLCPTMAQPPWPASSFDKPTDPPPEDGRHHAAEMTTLFNLTAPCPAMSVPVGFHPSGSDHAGLPIGMQIVGQRWRSDDVLRIGRAVELALPDASGQHPPL